METIGMTTGYGYPQSSFGKEQAWGSGQGGVDRGICTGDRLSCFTPQASQALTAGMEGNVGASGAPPSLVGAMQNLMARIAELLQGLQSRNAGGQIFPAQQYFRDASLRSTGDPHEAFSGSVADGGQVSAKWDSMRSHEHLITSHGIPGGFNVSTQVTPAGAAGVTYNRSAEVTTNNGRTVVTMGMGGAYSVMDDGQPVALASGQSTILRNGETVSLQGDGSLTVRVANAQGGAISTTLAYNGNGVDVNASASNVVLGGYLVHGGTSDDFPRAINDDDIHGYGSIA